ncbi:glycosyltransferase family 2 protein [Polynucleobacter paneuropaeus]|nr:glycosyltransferase family 2 protein [Polynucleobacter paneuropaeus]
MNKRLIVGIIILYNPDKERLSQCIGSIIRQLDYLIFINNSDESIDINYSDDPKIIKIDCNENLGIAAAQNIGLSKAIELLATEILLSDQDTIFPENYLGQMTCVLDREVSACAVVPCLEDDRGLITKSRIKIRRWGMKWRLNPSADKVMDVVEAPASGMVMKVDALKIIGPFREELFIDLVDLEWCWRARKTNFRVLSAGHICINHRLGNSKIRVLFKTLNSRHPMRSYYIARNTLFLAIRSRDISVFDRFGLYIDCIKYLIGFSLFFNPHYSHFVYSLRGFFHALIGKMGKLSDV